MNDFAHKAVVTPSLRPIFKKPMALILLYVIFHIPLVQLHLQLRILQRVSNFDLLSGRYHWPSHCRTVERVCTLGIYSSTCSSKAAIKNSGETLSPGRLHNAFPVWCSITSSLLTTRRSPLKKEHARMASIYFCLLVLAELPLPPKKICSFLLVPVLSISSMIPLDGAKNSHAVAMSQRPLLALYLNEKVPLAWHAGFSGTVPPRGCFPDLPLNQGRDLWSGKISQR